MVGVPDLGKFEGSTLTTPKNRRRIRERIRTAKCYEASLHHDDVCWPDDGSLSMTSKVHRARGLYALDSLNSNAWPAAEKYSCSTTADFVCYQEAKIGETAREETV